MIAVTRLKCESVIIVEWKKPGLKDTNSLVSLQHIEALRFEERANGHQIDLIFPTNSQDLSLQDEGTKRKSYILEMENIAAYIKTALCVLTRSDGEGQKKG